MSFNYTILYVADYGSIETMRSEYFDANPGKLKAEWGRYNRVRSQLGLKEMWRPFGTPE